ncbi:MAG TPA: tetratricopeptide repeat protein [Pyrinomonadaceae bacterium]|nr:tetratricopeptide repeat protein [Pyrinomonadaceae bacterium]
MTRDNLLFAIIGILLGFIAGFLLAGNITQREAAQRAAGPAAQAGQNLPPNHPPVGADQAGGEGGQQMLASVQSAMKQARENPNDFDAQLTAAKMEYQIQRYDQAIEYLLAANKVKPDDQTVLAMLGEANMDGQHFDAAAKWYKAALTKNPKDITSLDGYCFVLLQSGDTKNAEDALNKLAKADPTNQDLPQFRKKLDELKAGNK